MDNFPRVLVALPPGADHGSLIRYAAMLAQIGAGVEFRFVTVLPDRADASSPVDRTAIVESLQSKVEAAFAGLPDTVKTSVQLLEGQLLDRLLEDAAEQNADLMLVGHQPQHSARRASRRRLAMKAPCSLWLAPDDAAPTFSRVLAPIDFSEHSADALRVALALARRRGLPECLALHAYFDPGVATFDEYDAVLRGQEQAAFDQFLATIDCQGVRVEPLFVENAIVSHAIARIVAERGIDLVVMATRGRSPSAAILLGSATDETLAELNVPLLVVKHYGAHLSLLGALLNKDFLLKKGPRFG